MRFHLGHWRWLPVTERRGTKVGDFAVSTTAKWPRFAREGVGAAVGRHSLDRDNAGFVREVTVTLGLIKRVSPSPSTRLSPAD